MIKQLFGKLGLESRILILTVVPLLIITTGLTSYLIVTRQKDARDDLSLHATNDIQYLSRISEVALLAGDLNALATYAKVFMADENIKAVIFYDRNSEVLLASGSLPGEQRILPANGLYREKRGLSWIYQFPVIETGINVDDLSSVEPGPASDDPVQLGWVQIEINEQNLLDRERSILFTGLLIGLAGCVGLILLALRFGKSITRPLAELSETVTRLESGQLDARVEVEADGEVGELVKGINRLASRVKQSRQELEYQVEQATGQLRSTLGTLERKNIELQDTSSKLVEANNAKDEFLARMSHELRSPITSVLGYCRLLSQTSLKQDQQEYTNIINQASSVLLATSDDILDFSKLQAEAIQLETEPFDLEILLDAVLAMHAYAIHTKGLELILLVEADVPVKLIGDSFRLRQIINNLVANAVKFTETGYVAVNVLLLEESESEASLEFRVKDTGIGIKKELQKQMFEPFQQADASITRRYGGTGLGLVIAKKLVELMGGGIWIDENWHSGTEVVFTIKCERQKRASFVALDKISPAVQNVALYDANQLSCRAITGHLRNLGLSVFVCPKDTDPVEFLSGSDKRFSLFVISLSHDECRKEKLMPMINRLNNHFHGITLVISGLTMEAWNERCGQVSTPGNIAHLCKPLSRSILQNKVSSLLSSPQSSQSITIEKQAIAPVLTGLTIMVAEDNQFNRSLLVSILGHLGAVVFEAEDGKAAIELCRQRQIDLSIIDLHMPLMDGIEASREIRRENPDTPIIALTADIITSKAKVLNQAGVNLVLYKPVDEPGLIKAIVNLTEIKSDNFDTDTADKPLLARLPDHEVEKELNRLITLLASATKAAEFGQVKNIAHQLRGVAVARQIPDDIQEITGKIDRCFLESELDVKEIEALIEKLKLVNCEQKKP